jgi:hypothetical protein
VSRDSAEYNGIMTQKSRVRERRVCRGRETCLVAEKPVIIYYDAGYQLEKFPDTEAAESTRA